MNISINTVFRKDRLNSQNAAPVHLRLTQTRKNKFISTGVTRSIDDWDFENQRIKAKTPELQALQLRIDTKIDELRRKIKRLEALEGEVTLDNLLETNGRKINCTVGEYLKQTIERLEILGKYGSASKHRSLLSRLSQFRSLNIRFDEIDLAYLHDFELFLRKEGNTNNSIATKYAIFKAALTRHSSRDYSCQKPPHSPNTWLPCVTAILWTAGFTTPATRHRNCCPFNSYRTPCGLSRNTARQNNRVQPCRTESKAHDHPQAEVASTRTNSRPATSDRLFRYILACLEHKFRYFYIVTGGRNVRLEWFKPNGSTPSEAPLMNSGGHPESPPLLTAASKNRWICPLLRRHLKGVAAGSCQRHLKHRPLLRKGTR